MFTVDPEKLKKVLARVRDRIGTDAERAVIQANEEDAPPQRPLGSGSSAVDLPKVSAEL